MTAGYPYVVMDWPPKRREEPIMNIEREIAECEHHLTVNAHILSDEDKHYLRRRLKGLLSLVSE